MRAKFLFEVFYSNEFDGDNEMIICHYLKIVESFDKYNNFPDNYD